jgi:hypothetical protein
MMGLIQEVPDIICARTSATFDIDGKAQSYETSVG